MIEYEVVTGGHTIRKGQVNKFLKVERVSTFDTSITVVLEVTAGLEVGDWKTALGVTSESVGDRLHK